MPATVEPRLRTAALERKLVPYVAHMTTAMRKDDRAGQGGASDQEVILAEYAAMRAEILQLNGQIVTIFAGTLTLDVSVLGWFFSKDAPGGAIALPTIGIFFLALGSTVLTNRLRLAHRLGMFQRYFIEPKLPGITWATVYFQYRDELRKASGASTWGERLTESAFLLGVGVVNLAVLVVDGARPFWTAARVEPDPWKVFNIAAAGALLGAGWWLRARFRDYTVSDAAMRQIAERSGLTSTVRAGGADSATRGSGAGGQGVDPAAPLDPLN
jgi:hypothetical protein